jgi:hypothetical protein
MNPEVFRDELGSAIKTRLMNYAIEKNRKTNLEILERSVNNTEKIVEITRETILQALKGEVELLIFKQTFNEPIPTLFVSGVMHAIDVVNGEGFITNK